VPSGAPFAVNICPIARLPEFQPTVPEAPQSVPWQFGRSFKTLAPSRGAHVPLNMSAAHFTNPCRPNDLRNRTAKKLPNMSADVCGVLPPLRLPVLSSFVLRLQPCSLRHYGAFSSTYHNVNVESGNLT
jgi:hypothetical protein